VAHVVNSFVQRSQWQTWFDALVVGAEGKAAGGRAKAELEALAAAVKRAE